MNCLYIIHFYIYIYVYILLLDYQCLIYWIILHKLLLFEILKFLEQLWWTIPRFATSVCLWNFWTLKKKISWVSWVLPSCCCFLFLYHHDIQAISFSLPRLHLQVTWVNGGSVPWLNSQPWDHDSKWSYGALGWKSPSLELFHTVDWRHPKQAPFGWC